MTAAAAATLGIAASPDVRAFAERCGTFLHDYLSSPAASRIFARAGERRAMPDLVLADASGRPVPLSAFRGRVLLLTFFARSCRQCESEMRWFGEFQRTFGGRDFCVVGVALDSDEGPGLASFVQARQIDYPVVTGIDQAFRRQWARSVPTTLIVDRLGRVAIMHTGFCSKRQYQLDIEAVLAESPSPKG